MSAQPAPAPDSSPTPAENQLTDSRLQALHQENPVVKFFGLLRTLFLAVGSLRDWPKLSRKQRLQGLSAVASMAITATFLGYELFDKFARLIPDSEPIPVYEIQPTDTNLEKHDLWHVAPAHAANVTTGSEDEGFPRQIAAGASAEFRPEGARRLADFDGVFELLIRAIPQSSVWVLRQDLDEGAGYRFRLILPAKETEKARFEAHVLESGGKERAASCVTQGSAYGGIIQPGHVLRVTLRAHGNTVSHEFMLVSASPEIAHEQADGRTVAVQCRFPAAAPPGFIGFHALAGPLAIRNFRLCAAVGTRGYDPGCLDRQE